MDPFITSNWKMTKVENDKSVALNRSKGDFDAHMYLTPEDKSELNWWILNIETSYHKLHRQEPQQTITTDAPSLGGGQSITVPLHGGSWTWEEAKNHINYLEMLANKVLFCS